MVAISLTHANAKEMANRLRQFLAAGGMSIKQTHAYEALAKCLGYRDWNTLVGALQSTSPISQETAVEDGIAASGQSPRQPPTMLLIDRHAMAAHGVTVAHIESAFRREFPALLEKRNVWETLCYEQLPLRQLPPLRPPMVSIAMEMPEKAQFHEAVMECVTTVAEPKWIFSEPLRPGAAKLTVFFFPEHDVEQLLPGLREALTRLPAEMTVLSVEKGEPNPDHHAHGKWRTDGVSYFAWAWETDISMRLPDFQLLASMALKFNGDVLVRLRDVATLHACIPQVPDDEK
jgi:hypothetical protein